MVLSKDSPENCTRTSLELCFGHIKLPLFSLILREVAVCFADPEVNQLPERPVAAAKVGEALNFGGISRAQCSLLLVALCLAIVQSLGC